MRRNCYALRPALDAALVIAGRIAARRRAHGLGNPLPEPAAEAGNRVTVGSSGNVGLHLGIRRDIHRHGALSRLNSLLIFMGKLFIAIVNLLSHSRSIECNMCFQDLGCDFAQLINDALWEFAEWDVAVH